MRHPSSSDFMEALGVAPVEEDPSEGYFRYLISGEQGCELDLSFNVVAASFQVVLRCNGDEMVRLSSEMTRFIDLRREERGVSLYVEFDLPHCSAAAEVMLEPRLHCHWWALRA